MPHRTASTFPHLRHVLGALELEPVLGGEGHHPGVVFAFIRKPAYDTPRRRRCSP